MSKQWDKENKPWLGNKLINAPVIKRSVWSCVASDCALKEQISAGVLLLKSVLKTEMSEPRFRPPLLNLVHKGHRSLLNIISELMLLPPRLPQIQAVPRSFLQIITSSLTQSDGLPRILSFF